MVMEEGNRSSDSTGVVVKEKSGDGGLDVAAGSSSVSREVLEFKKVKKRARLSDSDGLGSDSSDDGEQLELKARKLAPGTTSNGNEFSDNDDDDGDDDGGGGGGGDGDGDGGGDGGGGVDENVRKTSSSISRLNVFEFDEYDDALDGKNSKGDIVYKRKHSFFDRPSSCMNKRVQGINGALKVKTVNNDKKRGSGVLKRYDDRSEAGLRSKDSVKTIALRRPSFYSEQKVRSNVGSSVREEGSKSKLRKSRPTKNVEAQDWISDDSDTPLKIGKNKLNSKKRSADEVSKDLDSDSGSSDVSLKLGKNKLNSKKTSAGKVSRDLDSDSDDSDASLKLTPKKRGSRKPLKSVRGKGEITPLSKMISPTSDGKVKRGSGTEKQILREKIKKMLLDAGWTIDYRPRRNRDYQDAVYINPSGSAYWSIIKAYGAFQKQAGKEEDDGDVKPSGESSCLGEIADLVLNKLTRQTGKKIQKEMKQKRREAISSKNKRPRASDKKGRVAKIDLNDSDTEKSQSEDNYTSDDNCNGKLVKGRKLGRCTLVVRGAAKNSQADDYIPYTGKRTLLSWLIDWGIVGLKEKVQYIMKHKERRVVLLEGWITRGGIHCGCCSKILTVAKFEMHAGGSKLRQPYQNIYLESGISLLQCQMDAWNKQEESDRSDFQSVYVDDDDPNDDTCGICGDGGDLICCDGCPSTFHQACLGMKMLPTGDWNCSNCACKFCGMAGSINPDANNMTGCDLPTCSLCERKYHKSCIRDVDDLPDDSTSLSFCGKKCREMFENLQKLVGVKHELDGGFSWLLIHRTDTKDANVSVKSFAQDVESNSKVAVALTVMDECFLPILDRRSGISIIHNVLYNCGSNFSRLNFCGFYTAILERGDEIISAASLRFHGPELAEMPFIGTRHIYRLQGMCNRLYRAIESALCSLTVEKLIIPAISQLVHTWTEVFGFEYLEESQKKELGSINMLVFPGIDMLQKLLKKDENNHLNVTTITDAKLTIHEHKASLMADHKLNKSDEDSLAEHDNIAASDSAGSEDTLDDVSEPNTCNESHEVKVSDSNDELSPKSSKSKEKVPESDIEPKPILSFSGSKEDPEMKDNVLILDASNCNGTTEVLDSEDVLMPDASNCKETTEFSCVEVTSDPDTILDDESKTSEEFANCRGNNTEVPMREDNSIAEREDASTQDAFADGVIMPSEGDRENTTKQCDTASNCIETTGHGRGRAESKDDLYESGNNLMRDSMVHATIKLSEQVLHADDSADKRLHIMEEICEEICANSSTEEISETVSVKV